MREGSNSVRQRKKAWKCGKRRNERIKGCRKWKI